ncbi:MAG: MATE family efflux transporter [Lachnospiraceae bacterium]|nr:MATE family efflux transporter [Lachnospiraceae bacterium]
MGKNIQISESFTAGKLIRFTFLPMISFLLSSLYTVVDGWFISNYISSGGFAAVTLSTPFIMAFPAVGFMIGGGGNALLAKVIGENDSKRANAVMSQMLVLCTVTGFLISIPAQFLLRPFVIWQGARGELLENAVEYGQVMLLGITFLSLLYCFELFLVTAGQQKFALFVTIYTGIINCFLDAFFIIVLKWGLKGAALASVISQGTACLIPLLYFMFSKKSLLRFRPAMPRASVCLKACGNGLSEMIENIAQGAIGILYNIQLLKLAGEDGVAAYGVVMNIWLVYTLLLVGFNEAAIPVIAYHYGAQDKDELKNLFRICLRIMGISCLVMFVLTELFAPLMADIFLERGTDLIALSVRAFRICGFSLLFIGVNYFATSFFTALNDGLVSGLISVFVMLVFPFVTVMILPIFFSIDGIWASISVTNVLGFVVAAIAFIWGRKKYGYC